MAIMNYNPVAGVFVPVAKDGVGAAVEKALAAAKNQVGDAAWKRGNSQNTPGGPTAVALAELAKINYKAPVIEGKLTKVAYVTTSDGQGNQYRKVRVQLDAAEGGEDFLLSLDVDGELAQGLIQKLDKCERGQVIKVSAFQVPVERADRLYVNHKASVKSGGQEVKAEGFWAKSQEAASAAKAALQAAAAQNPKFIKADTKALNQVAAEAKVEAHIELLKEIEARFATSAPAATPAPAPAETSPGEDI